MTITATTFAVRDKVVGYDNPVTEIADLHAGVIVSFGPATTRYFRYGDTAPEISRRLPS